ncbi:hypothetical protein [Lactococcus lactis]|uniref:WxL domain-containing protein n=1 Tax=Lactococcus lactis TaxID=1358 RepID=A0AAW5TSH5_9LACT|nr:hypothetical protein [Lactococcus lactis]MCW2282225.1 hypothetical protein [Lactococcus lactis]
MFNSKKFFTLCATSIAGFSAVASIAPVSVFADAAKNGETVVTYDGTPQPAEWGLSVPATVKLDKNGNVDTEPGVYGVGKLAIVTETGADYKDSVKNHVFNVHGSVSADKIGEKPLYFGAGNQGNAEPTSWVGTPQDNLTNGLDIMLTTTTSGSVAPNLYINFGVKDEDAGTVNVGDSTTVSWTAAEN